MQTINFNLKQILAKVKDKEFRIPQFQRDFRWNSSQVKLLVDSIARNYPIGSLLMMTQNSEMPEFSSRSVEAEVNEINFNVDENERIPPGVYFVLDGQQRLTSIARVFLNADPKMNYYFDLKEMITSFERDDGTRWIINRSKRKDDRRVINGGRLLRTDVAIHQEDTDVFVFDYIVDSGEIPELENDKHRALRVAARIKGRFETIRNYQIPVVVLDRDAGIESVCRVFETINSTGTRLTTFDLAVARFFPKPDLRDLWRNAQEKYPILKRFEVDGERVLQVLSLWHSYENQKFTEPTRSKLLKLGASFIFDRWDMAVQKLAEAYTWAEENGASPRTLPKQGILVSIAGFLAVFPDFFDDPMQNHRPILRRWYFSKILQRGARAANYIIGQDFDALIRYAEQGEVLPPEEVKLNAASINRIRRTADNRYKALHCIMAMTAKDDLLSGNTLHLGEVEDHHIYPRALRKVGEFDVKKLDAITNRIIISRRSNNTLSDTPPYEYFSELQKRAVETGIEGQVNRRLKQCLIPGDVTHISFAEQFSLQNFDIFLNSRAEMLLERVRELIGDVLLIEENLDDED